MKKWNFDFENQVFNFSNGGQLDKIQIINLKGNYNPDQVKQDLLKNTPEGWDENMIQEFYEFLLEQ